MSKEIRKASELRPWLKNYPEGYRNIPVTKCTIEEIVRAYNPDLERVVIEYYDSEWSMNQCFEMADKAAKAMVAAGVKCGDHLPVFMQFQPEFLFLLFAAEKVGAALVCRDGSDEEYLQALHDAKGPLCFIHDFFESDQEELFYTNCEELKHIVAINPYTLAKKETMPDYVLENIESRYSDTTIDKKHRDTTISWDEFMAMGEGFEGEYIAERNPDRNLYHPYTSGSTGPSKEIMHSAATLTAILGQLCPLMSQVPFPMRCILPVLPPALIAMVGPTCLLYLSTGHREILDPYCGTENADLELMRYQPNGTIGVSCLGRAVLESKRIPADFQIPQLIQFGGGAEPLNNKLLKRYHKWCKDHGAVHNNYSMGFGQTEAGPVISAAGWGCDHFDLKNGLPLPNSIVSVFDQDCNEMDYADIGEICISSPGVMIGYAKQEDTDKVIKIHEDGRRWLHTGDYGYLTDKGEVIVVSRGWEETISGGKLFLMHMENKVCEIPGIFDCFFLSVPDEEHPGYKVPYFYMVPDEGADMTAIEEAMKEALEPFEYPKKIFLIKERPWFHFKTNRRGLLREIMAKRAEKQNQ